MMMMSIEERSKRWTVTIMNVVIEINCLNFEIKGEFSQHFILEGLRAQGITK